MSETLTFHFEGSLADTHRMNFYESARFQYAAARLIVKLDQFREGGKFVKNITGRSNSNIQLMSQSDGSFNINIEAPEQSAGSSEFIRVQLSDLIAYVSERIIEKIDETALANAAVRNRAIPQLGGALATDPNLALDATVDSILSDQTLTAGLPAEVRDVIKRRAAETYRERRLKESHGAIARIDFARSQKLTAMSAPLISEMATALRRSADTLEITSSTGGRKRSVLFLDQRMAQEIETARVDEESTPMIGDITQLNKDNGWGKLKVDGGAKMLSFSIPADILPYIRQPLIDSMKHDRVNLQTYIVRDRANDIKRLIVVGVLQTPGD